MLSVKIQRYSAGVYKITNLKNGNFYIGSSVNIYNRFHTHSNKLFYNNHSSKYLQNAYNKYGKNSFFFEVLEYCDKKIIEKREQYYIDLLNPKYNIRKIAQINLGISPNKITREKISKSLKEKYNTGLKSYRQNHIWRSINVFTLEGDFIKHFNCIMDACRELGISKANLRRALNSKGRALTYQFRDAKDPFPGKYVSNVNQYGRKKIK
jgi:hypothetical protein